MKNKHLFYTLQLARSKNLGPKTFNNLLFEFGTPKKVVENISKYPRIELADDDEIWKEMDDAEKFGAKFLSIMDESYPVFLKEIDDFPIVLTLIGDLSLLKSKKIAIVGSRNASINSLNLTQEISKELSDDGVVVVSGLAKGIDLAAHKGAIKRGTIAVIAGGIDNVYPKENEEYFEKITRSGLIISEQKFGSRPIASNFIARNRIISALSDVVLIAQGSTKSGSMTTARFAYEQGKRIYAIPGSIMDDRFAGTNALIKEQRANILSSVDDILEEFGVEPIYEEEAYDDGGVDEILEFLSFEPISIDDLVKNSGIWVSELNSRLVELELSGRIIITGENICLSKSKRNK